jgi:hypothetical protein
MSEPRIITDDSDSADKTHRGETCESCRLIGLSNQKTSEVLKTSEV